MIVFKRLLALLLIFSVAACASLVPRYEKPHVNISSFTLDPKSTGLAPQFNIGLHIVNPNRTTLPLVGMSYSVEIEGHRILSGAEADLPRIEAYGSADITIQASPDLFGSARLLNQLLTGQEQQLDYLFKAKLDVGTLMPYITIKEQGSFGLTD